MTLHDEDRQSDCGLYVLGALRGGERADFEAHLRSCDECTASVHDFRIVSGALLYSVPVVEVPSALRDRIVTAASRARPARAEATPIHLSAHVERQPRRNVLALTGWLATAATVLVAAGVAMWVVDLQSRLRDSEQRLSDAIARLSDSEQRLQASQQETTTVRQTLALLTVSDSIELRLAGQAPARQASARAFLSRSRGVLFAASNLPPIPAGRTYQVWYLTRGAPVSAGLIKPDADGGAMAEFTPPSVAVPVGMAVSLEPDGGVPAPTGAIYLATQ